MMFIVAHVCSVDLDEVGLYVHEPVVIHSHCIYMYEETNTTNIVISLLSHI